MNSQSVANQVMEELRQTFEQYAQQRHPDRLITRQWKERDEYSKEQRNKGVHALLYRGEIPSNNPGVGMIRVLAYGLIRVHTRDGNGLELEQKELELIEQLKGFSQSDSGALLHINNIVSSLQVECPEGWYMAECEYGPVDLSITPNPWDDGRQFTGDMYVGCAPDIGAAHKDDYLHLLEDDDE
ncbi:hypothetical protein NX722_13645 [Endozoicomonas gorgoniicola]|uniref:Uncharacterized protein n=1 Tax=Endozoicomonas gorgoniicola TaxID=1234144 RepID=A0ABT3MWA3_9GAMM|nr:hypothetical protein [Endozoicomonas gorgoniicola]MCW7553652.1 hypothetical protein [Endozoicomonas gorgoniicola]